MSHNPDDIAPFPAPLDDVARNQLAEFQREGLADWRLETKKRLDREHAGWQSEFDSIDEAAEVLLGETPYAEF